VRRAQAALDLVAAWDARDHVGTMLALVDAVESPEQPVEVRRMIVDAHVLAHRLGHTEDLAALERRYQALREDGGAVEPLLLNNLAVVVAERGRGAEAQALWSAALEHADGEQGDVLRLNALAARISAGARGAAERAELQELATSGKAVEIQLQAHAWLVATSEGAERRAATKVLREVARKEAATNVRPRNLPGTGGMILRGSVKVGLGYSTSEGMQLELDVTSVPWLMVRCPVAVPD
jgi:hypothetical protein